MKPIWHSIILFAAFFTASCQTRNQADGVVSQKFIHKYGFPVSEQEWNDRAEEGQIVTLLKNGVKITRSYENGILHGPTTHTFPNSPIVQKSLIYDQGILLKEWTHDVAGVPLREEMYEFDDRVIVTIWDHKGVPLSIEEFEGDLLVQGKYYTPEHKLEAKIEGGSGEKIKRDRSGVLLAREQVENGVVVKETTFHPNGQIHTVSHYHDHQLHGERNTYSSFGQPLSKTHWNHGVLHGAKSIYRNSYKVVEIPYVDGQKHGTELHYDDLGNLTTRIEWKNDKKHGPSQIYSDDSYETEWFYKGRSVTMQKFEALQTREALIAEFNGEMEDSEEWR